MGTHSISGRMWCLCSGYAEPAKLGDGADTSTVSDGGDEMGDATGGESSGAEDGGTDGGSEGSDETEEMGMTVHRMGRATIRVVPSMNAEKRY